MAVKNILSGFFPSRVKTEEGIKKQINPITLTPVIRRRYMTEEQRRAYATELLDTYSGFGKYYIAALVKVTFTNQNIRREMLKVVRCLNLLEFFTNSISRVYATQPSRKFYLDGKEIIKTPAELTKNEANREDLPFNEVLNTDKFVHDDDLYEALNDLYNDSVTTAIKQAERFTNLLNTTIYKVVTDELGQIRLVFIPNDTAQVIPSDFDLSSAEQIAFVQDTMSSVTNNIGATALIENWSRDVKDIPNLNNEGEEYSTNEAAIEYEKLFDTKDAGSGFAPFVVFRDVGNANDFWDQKDKDNVDYIKSINMSLTQLKYLEDSSSFGLKYTVNIKEPINGVVDPRGITNFAVANNVVPGTDNNKNYEIGEFKNEGRIDDVIKSIIFNLKMLFSLHNIPLDALISTNSVRSAENKQMDNEELFASINAQRDIWNKNEQVNFGVMQAVHNRDNDFKIPKGIEMIVNYSESTTDDKVAEDWMVEIQNNVSTVIDWLADIHPDLDRDELMELLVSNKEINDKQKREPLDINSFTQVDEQGNLIVPKDPEEDNINKNQDNDDNNDNPGNN